MPDDLLGRISSSLPGLRAAVRREVAKRLAGGATIGAAIDGEVHAIRRDPVTGERFTRILTGATSAPPAAETDFSGVSKTPHSTSSRA